MELELSAARFRALHMRPYFSAAMCNLMFIPSPGLGTLGVDHRYRCYYDPAVLSQWDVHGLASVLIHEIGHLLRNHHDRAKALDADDRIWNLAADAEINDDLVCELDIKFPADPVLPTNFGLTNGLLAEQYYQELIKNAKRIKVSVSGSGASDGDDKPSPSRGNCGSCSRKDWQPWEQPSDGIKTSEDKQRDGKGLSDLEKELVRRAVARDIKAAAAKGQGHVPAGWQRWADEVLTAKVDWASVIRAAVRGSITSIGRADYSYSRPSRRQSIFGRIIMPSMISYKLSIGFLIDTSGSMFGKQLSQGVAEVWGAIQAMGYQDVLVASCDAAVHNKQKVFNKSQIALLGGGGTSMTKGIEELAKHRPKLDILIVITDCLTDWPKAHPPINMLIVKVGSGKLPAWPCKSVNVPGDGLAA